MNATVLCIGQKVPRPDDVDSIKSVFIVGYDDRRQMHHRCNTLADPVDGLRIGDVAGSNVYPLAGEPGCGAIIRQRQYPYGIPTSNKLTHQHAADRSGSAGNQNRCRFGHQLPTSRLLTVIMPDISE